MSHPTFVLAVDIGGTRTKFGLVNRSSGELVQVAVQPTEFSETGQFIETLQRTVSEMAAQGHSEWGAITGIGIGLPGYVDGDDISQVWESLAFMEGDQFRPALEQALHLPVKIENDGHAIALAEYYYGNNNRPERLLSLTLGTGIGFGMIVNGIPHEKKPLTHMAPHILIRPGAAPCYCGFNGCMETLVNGRRLVTIYQRLRRSRDDPDLSDAQAILEKASEYESINRNGAALLAVNEMLQDLITGLNIFIYTYAPDVFVLGGGLSQGLHTFLPKIEQGLIAQPYQGFHSQVRISRLGEKAGLWGAAALIINIPDRLK